MTLQLYRLKFNRAHFGNDLLSTTDINFSSHRLFSALFLEALKYNLSEDLLKLAVEGDLHISNSFLYHYGLYLPNPVGYPQIKFKNQMSDDQLKLYKNMPAIHFYDFSSFVRGELTQEALEQMKEEYNEGFKIVYDTHVNVKEDPYRVGIVSFEEDVELAVIGTKHQLVEYLFDSLQYSGIGGKRSSGLGGFTLTIGDLEDELKEKIVVNSSEKVMLLNSALPKDEELDSALEGAFYQIERTGGFAYSTASKDFYRKQDLYKLKSGSVFNATFFGDVYDVAPENYEHPVWNYGIPLFYEMSDDLDSDDS